MVCFVCVVAIVCSALLLAVVYKTRNRNRQSLIIWIIILLILANLCYMWYTLAGQDYQRLLCSTADNIKTQYVSAIAQYGVSCNLGVVAYTMAHWLLAQKYWQLSHLMESYLDDDCEDHSDSIELTHRVVMANIVLWPVVSCLVWFVLHSVDNSLLVNVIFYFTLFVPVVLDIASLVLLAHSFGRIKQISQTHGYIVNNRLM